MRGAGEVEGGVLHVFEVPAEMPTEYVTRLMNRLKKETAEAFT